MTQQVKTAICAGGLDLITPPIVMPPGKLIAALNYEPDVNGYTRIGGYERFNGMLRPSDSSDPAVIEARRANITPVPGEGPVRGVTVYNGALYAFRDEAGGESGKMYRATASGWQVQTSTGYILFNSGTAEFFADDTVVGGTSGATATIVRVAHTTGDWSGTAGGYIMVRNVSGTFQASEALTSSGAGAAQSASGYIVPVLSPGGKYDFVVHNFFAAAQSRRLYFVNGEDTGYEFSGTWFAPLHTYLTDSLSGDDLLQGGAPPPSGQQGDTIEIGGEAPQRGDIIMLPVADSPSFISEFQKHMMLGYSSGVGLNSSTGEPLQFMTTTGAGEMGIGEAVTGFSTSATALMIFGNNRISYLQGHDTEDFDMKPLSVTAGAKAWTVQTLLEPTYLDDGGVRTASTTPAFGDWRMGSLTQLIEPMVNKKRDDLVVAEASTVIKAKDQYKLFWSDGTGITVYIGRKNPEAIPFKLPIQVFCACFGEIETGLGDRVFVGATDGYVYELNRGTSFDGAPIPAYLRLPFNHAKSPSQHIRWMKASFELQTPDPIEMAFKFDIDYGFGDSSLEEWLDVQAGSPTLTTDIPYGSVPTPEGGLQTTLQWMPVAGRIEHHIAGIGPNIAATLITQANDVRAHTVQSQTYNFSPRRLKG